MIFIITGNINSGKSSFLLSLYRKNNLGDGFYNRKLFSASTYIGQEIVHISTGNSCPISYRFGYIPAHWDELFTYQDYSFSKSGILFCRDIMKNMMNTPYPCYIDEIGPLELEEKGLFHDFEEILHTRKDIYVVVRDRCLSDVISKFKINRYIIL